MRNENFYVVQGWMINELNLSGNELVCYAIIYGITQGGQTVFKESRSYLSEWMNATLPTVDRVLKSLVGKNYIKKESVVECGVRFNYYRAVHANFTTPKESLQGGGKESLPHNNIIINNNKEEKDKSFSKKESENLFEECWKAYNRKGSKKKSMEQWCRLSESELPNIMSHIKVYVGSRERQFQKDFERYLRDKTFNDVISKGNQIIYDPTKGVSNDYRPATDGAIVWDEKHSCYLYLNMFFGYIPDGYTDENRPNGARIILSNGRGFIVWNSETKAWENE